MKFTKEQAIESLKRELSNNGRKTLYISDRTFETTIEPLLKNLADDETGLPDFITTALTILSPMNDNARKYSSDSYKKGKKDAEDEANGDPIDNQTEPTSKGQPTENPEMKALLERIAALEKDKAETNKRASIAQKRKDLESKLSEKGVKDKEWLDGFLSEVNITEEFDVDGKVDTYVKLYNKSQATGGGAPTPLSPQGTPTENTYADSIKAASAMAKRNRAVLETNN